MRRLNSQTLILTGAILFVLYLAGVPLLMLLYGSVRSAPIGEPGASFTIQNYVRAYVDNSLYFAVGICAVTWLIGNVPGRVSERTNTPFKRLFIVMASIPFIIPGIPSTISWILRLSPKIALSNLTVKNLLGWRPRRSIHIQYCSTRITAPCLSWRLTCGRAGNTPTCAHWGF